MDRPFSVMGHLSKWLNRPRIGDSKPPTLWPSAAGATDKDGNFQGTCRRQAFLQYIIPLVKFSKATDNKYQYLEELAQDAKSKLEPPNKYQLWLFDNADRYEQYITEHAKESGIYIAHQVPVFVPKWNISGKIDLIVMNPENGKNIISEVKSVYSFSAEEVLGKNFDRFHNFTGEPRTKNLMQVSLYQWHFANDTYDTARLQYGDRGTGKYAEYEVNIEDGNIQYRCIDPVVNQWKEPTYKISDILTYYESILNSIEVNLLPPRDFSLIYSADELESKVNLQYEIVETDKEDKDIKLYKTIQEFIANAEGVKGRKFHMKSKINGKLSKSTAEQFVKWKDRKTNGGRGVKAPEDGDYQCFSCNFRNFCYNENGSIRV